MLTELLALMGGASKKLSASVLFQRPLRADESEVVGKPLQHPAML